MHTAEYLGEWAAGSGNHRIALSMFGTGGKGLCGILTGGETAHIGGTAYASPRMRSDGSGLTADVSTICGYGHKDVYIAQKAANRICVAVNEVVSISAGIHLDHAHEEDFRLISDNTDTVVDLFITDYLSRNTEA